MEHRGGKGLEDNTGDGAGILFQIPHRYFRQEAQKQGHLLPNNGEYGVAMIFLPQDPEKAEKARDIFETVCTENGVTLLFWGKVPVDPSNLGFLGKILYADDLSGIYPPSESDASR
jgi:glutamate synthase (ferredoxin)